MIQTRLLDLPHGISLSCRLAGDPTRPVLMFLHGFPEAAFVWDVGSSRVDLQACKLEYSIVSPK